MKNMEKFSTRLNNFILFSKGWYESVDKKLPRIELYKKLLKLDGYDFIQSYQDVISIILIQFDEYNKFLIKNGKQTLDFYQFFKFTNDNMYVYGMSYEEAIISVILTYFREMSSEFVIIEKPVYNRKLFKFGIKFSTFFGKYKIGMTYKEQNNYTEKIFG